MNELKTRALAIRNTPWQPMAGMPTNVLNSGGLRIARCDFDGDFDHADALANAAYIIAASPDVIIGLIAERDALQAKLEVMQKDAERYQWLFSDINLQILHDLDQSRVEPPTFHQEITANLLGFYVTKEQCDKDIDAAKEQTP